MHSLLFELVLLVICVPVMALVFKKSFGHTGVMSVGISLAAMICNGLYNYSFDRALVFLKRPLYPRSFCLRCFHSVLFEICLMTVTLPMLMCWMDITFFQAFITDLSFAVFVPVYALLFNWGYDLLFPVPQLECCSIPNES